MAKKKQKKESGLPAHFIGHAVIFILAITALLMFLAFFSVGGALPGWILSGAKWLFGRVAYILPFMLLYMGWEIFRSEQDDIPKSLYFGAGVALILLSGFLHVFADNPTSLDFDDLKTGGGIVGYLLSGLFLLKLLSPLVAGIVLFAASAMTLAFLLDITVKQLFGPIFSKFGFDKFKRGSTNKTKPSSNVEASNLETLKAAKKFNSKDFKLRKGVPVKEGLADAVIPRKTPPKSKDALTATSDPNWKFPSVELLSNKQDQADAGDVKGNAKIIQDTLEDFKVDVEMEGANIGPRVTQYELKPSSGVRLNKITSLENNIALNLAAEAIRIEAPIPGKRAVGIEVPNKKGANVMLRSILEDDSWKHNDSPLSFVIGRDIAGEPTIMDLASAPHLLVAGATGSGKSVMINTLLTSLLYRNTPADLRLILVDPKQVELTPYNDIPHLLTPVITQPEKTLSALKWAVSEMERRYTLLAENGKRDIKGYNSANKDADMPYIVIVIDELADLMMMAARDVESLIVRVAQKARAVGIHLVLATQRPSVDVITGLIKANIPARIAFTVTSQVDSRTIIDGVGAEKLLGKGDMLLSTPRLPKPKRVQAAFTSEKEAEKITDFIREQRPPEYNDEVVAQPVTIGDRPGMMSLDSGNDEDSMFEEAVKVVIESGKASSSLLQRRLRVGYARAARLVEDMETKGIVGPPDGSRPREVLVGSLDEVFGNNSDDDADVPSAEDLEF